MALGLSVMARPELLVGYDIEPTDVEDLQRMAKEHGIDALPEGLRFELSAPDHVPAPSGTFDFILSWSAFEHIEQPRVMAQEIRRLMAPGAIAMIQLFPFYHSEHGDHGWTRPGVRASDHRCRLPGLLPQPADRRRPAGHADDCPAADRQGRAHPPSVPPAGRAGRPAAHGSGHRRHQAARRARLTPGPVLGSDSRTAIVRRVTATAEDIDSISTAGPPSPTPGVVGAVFVPPADEQHLLIAARSLERAGIPFFAGGPFAPTLRQFADAGYRCLEASTAADLVNRVWAAHHLPVLAVGDAITLPDDFLTRALELLGDDLRIATVSFLSNDAALLSFPERNRPSARPPDGQDATSVTRLLRQRGPRTLPDPHPDGQGRRRAAGRVRTRCRRRSGHHPGHQPRLLDRRVLRRAADRGFIHVLDDTVFYARHRSAASAPWTPRPSTTWTPRSVTTSISTTRWRSPTCTRKGPRTRRPWRSPSGWPRPRSAGCGSWWTAPTSVHTRWARRSPCWPRSMPSAVETRSERWWWR